MTLAGDGQLVDVLGGAVTVLYVVFWIGLLLGPLALGLMALLVGAVALPVRRDHAPVAAAVAAGLLGWYLLLAAHGSTGRLVLFSAALALLGALLSRLRYVMSRRRRPLPASVAQQVDDL